MRRIIALMAAFILTLLAQPAAAQGCESVCAANPDVVTSGTIPSGTTVTYGFVPWTDLDGEGTIVYDQQGVPTCTTCEQCSALLEFAFDAGSTSKEACYTLGSWSNWQLSSGDYRTFLVEENCDATPETYEIYVGEISTACGVSPDYSATARLYCGCL